MNFNLTPLISISPFIFYFILGFFTTLVIINLYFHINFIKYINLNYLKLIKENFENKIFNNYYNLINILEFYINFIIDKIYIFYHNLFIQVYYIEYFNYYHKKSNKNKKINLLKGGHTIISINNPNNLVFYDFLRTIYVELMTNPDIFNNLTKSSIILYTYDKNNLTFVQPHNLKKVPLFLHSNLSLNKYSTFSDFYDQIIRFTIEDRVLEMLVYIDKLYIEIGTKR